MPGKPTIPRVCLHCEQVFYAKTAHVKAGGAKYCTRACLFEALKRRVERICEQCGMIFVIPPSALKRPARFCGVVCHGRNKVGRHTPVEERVWKHIDRRSAAECWPWTASVDVNGYGQINDGNGRIRKAHQISLEIKLGRPLTSGEWGLHHCDNPPCCNPDHLYAGTAADNMRDMLTRGRGRLKGAPGQRNANAKLTDALVREIRAKAANGPRGTQAQLARAYGVSPAIIAKIVRGEMWQHVS